MPESLKPENRNVVVMIPVIEKVEKLSNIDPLEKLLQYIRNSDLVSDIFLITCKSFIDEKCLSNDVQLIERPWDFYENKKVVPKVGEMSFCLDEINAKGKYPDYIIYFDHTYFFRPKNLIRELIFDVCYKGLDTVFMGHIERSSHFIHDLNKATYLELSSDALPSLDNRLKIKTPIYCALLGPGCITRSRILRTGQLIGEGNIGIIPTDDIRYTLSSSRPQSIPIIEMLIDKDISDS
jgi:hypothetical protein